MSEEHLEHLLGISGLGTWEWDLAADRLRVSSRSHALLGYTAGELDDSGETWLALLHAEDRGAVLEQRERLRRGELGDLVVDARFAARGGEWRWLRCRGRVVQRDGAGRPLLALGTHADLTPEKEVEAALRRSEERYRTLVESQGEGIGVVDDEERFIFANMAAERIFGLAAGTMVGRSLKEFVDEEELQRVLEQTGRRRTGSRDTYEMSFRRADGERRVLLVTATPRVDGGGAYSGAFGVFRDITERKRAEEALRESEERYRQLIESLPHGVGVIQHGRVIFANRAALRILGIGSVEELRGMAPASPLLGAERERVTGLVRGLLEGTAEGPLHYLTESEGPDGQAVPLEVYVTAISHRGAPAAQIFFMDISDRRREEEQRRLLEEQLLESRKLESVGRLAGGIAHEFNNLLTPMIINASMALQEMTDDDPRRPDMDDILAASTRAKELIRQLLAFSRQQMLAVQNVDLNALIDEWYTTLRRLIREDIVVELDLIGGGLPPLVQADPSQLQEVLVKLVLNAGESMPGGGVIRVCTEIREIGEDAGGDLLPGTTCVELSVSDTGRGMDAETVSRVFDPFYSTKDPSLGAGLGLASVHGIVAQHGGHIEVHSEPGQGSTFRIYLPLADGTDEEAQAEEMPELEPVGEGATVLVVEDEELLRRQICRILRRYGFDVLEAEDGVQALERAEQHGGPIHLLLSDMVMPRLGGKELARRLTRGRPEVRVILMSGYTDELMSEEHGSEAAEVLEKPFTLRGMVQRILTALGR